MINLGALARPNTVSIFKSDPASLGKVVAFILENVAIPVPFRTRLDLMHSGQASQRYTAARSPIERAVADNIRREPERLVVSGQLSATPLGGPLLTGQGALGSIIRRDLREVAKLRKILARREPVIVVTPWRVYPSMVGSLDESHDGSNKVEVTLSFEEIRIVSPLAIAGAIDLDALLAGADADVAMGGQATETVSVAGAGLG